MDDADRQRKVLALYRKAAGTDNPAERDAFLAKARQLDHDLPCGAPAPMQSELARFFGERPSVTPQERRRASWRRYAAKVTGTPAFRARRAAYMRDYRMRRLIG